MEERRSNGFRVKPSFGQVLGYIQEGEPLTLDLPNRKASIYTSPKKIISSNTTRVGKDEILHKRLEVISPHRISSNTREHENIT